MLVSSANTLSRNLAEQREAANMLLADPEYRGAKLWLADLVAEEILIRDEICQHGGVRRFTPYRALWRMARDHGATTYHPVVVIGPPVFGNVEVRMRWDQRSVWVSVADLVGVEYE